MTKQSAEQQLTAKSALTLWIVMKTHPHPHSLTWILKIEACTAVVQVNGTDLPKCTQPISHSNRATFGWLNQVSSPYQICVGRRDNVTPPRANKAPGIRRSSHQIHLKHLMEHHWLNRPAWNRVRTLQVQSALYQVDKTEAEPQPNQEHITWVLR